MNGRILLLAVLVAAAPLPAQTRLLIGTGGGFGGGFPPSYHSCDQADMVGAQVAAWAGVQLDRVALFADAGIIVASGEDCAILVGGPGNTSGQYHNDISYPMRPLTINARVDLLGIDNWTTYARAGGGIFLDTDINVVTAGIGARRKTGHPAFGVELLYSQFDYEREFRYSSVEPDAVAGPPGTARPVVLRVLLHW